MKDKQQGSHQEDSLGGRSKDSQRRPIPEAVDFPTDADIQNHAREREKANAATGPSVAGIPELTPHIDKRDLPPNASGKSTRVSKESDGSISQPNAGTSQDKPEQDAHGGSFELGAQGRKRPASQQVEQVRERDVKKLHETRDRQLGSNGKRAN